MIKFEIHLDTWFSKSKPRSNPRKKPQINTKLSLKAIKSSISPKVQIENQIFTPKGILQCSHRVGSSKSNVLKDSKENIDNNQNENNSWGNFSFH